MPPVYVNTPRDCYVDGVRHYTMHSDEAIRIDDPHAFAFHRPGIKKVAVAGPCSADDLQLSSELEQRKQTMSHVLQGFVCLFRYWRTSVRLRCAGDAACTGTQKHVSAR